MPVYLFTFHAYGSWLPDRKIGYVQSGKGILDCDPQMAQNYRRKQKEDEVTFTTELQQHLIDTLQNAKAKARFRLHAIATDPTHLHILLSWQDEHPTAKLKIAIKQALTRQLNEAVQKQQWFSRKGSQKRVRDKQHFEYLLNVYLPKHKGLSWYES